MNLLIGAMLIIALLYGCTELAHRTDCEAQDRANCSQDIEPD